MSSNQSHNVAIASTSKRKRLRRFVWQPPFAAALTGLVIASVTAILWARSWSVADAIWAQSSGGFSATAMSQKHMVMLCVGHADDLTWGMNWRPGIFFNTFRSDDYGFDRFMGQQGGTILSHLGLVQVDANVPAAYASSDHYHCETEGVHAIYIPHALVILLFGWFPVRYAAVLRERRRRSARVLQGRCPNCGYDIRATPQRCPECGTTVVALAEAKS